MRARSRLFRTNTLQVSSLGTSSYPRSRICQNATQFRLFSNNASKTNLDRFVTSDVNVQPKSNSLLAYAVSQALKNLIPPRLDDDYRVDFRGEVLGEGRFGTIRPCVHIITGVEAAVKTQYKMQCKRNPATGQFYELEAMRSLIPGAFAFYNSYETALKLHIVTERLRGPSVFDYLNDKGWQKPRNDREERECAKTVARLLRAVNLAHRSGLAHLDVKFENFMFRKAKDPDAGVDPVLIDYGAARPINGPRNLVDIVGSPSYAAPEVVLKGKFSDRSDAWSLGVMAFTILQGCFPFERLESRMSDYHAYFCPIEWRRISREAQDFCRGLLKVEPAERMSLKQAMMHPWILKAESPISLPSSGETNNEKEAKIIEMQSRFAHLS